MASTCNQRTASHSSLIGRALEPLERDGQSRQSLTWQRVLDQREQLALFQPDVRREESSQLVEADQGRVAPAGDQVDAVADGHVVAQDPSDERLVGIAMSRVGREQHLLLEPKVPSTVALPEREQSRSGLG